MRCTVITCTPLCPNDRACAFNSIIRRTITGLTSSPTLQAWLFTRFSCKVLSSSGEMFLLHREPKPVVMPYKGSRCVSIFRSR